MTTAPFITCVNPKPYLFPSLRPPPSPTFLSIQPSFVITKQNRSIRASPAAASIKVVPSTMCISSCLSLPLIFYIIDCVVGECGSFYQDFKWFYQFQQLGCEGLLSARRCCQCLWATHPKTLWRPGFAKLIKLFAFLFTLF